MQNKNTIRILIIAIVSMAVITIAVYLLRANSKKFRDFMDDIIPAPLNPFEMANIILKSNQEAYVKKLHPEVQNKFRAFIKETEDSGWTVIPTSGYRSVQEQVVLHNKNKSNAKPGKSSHNYGLALDINASKGTVWLKKASSEAAWVNSGIPAIAKKHGLTWVYRFGSYVDPVHFYYKADTAKLLERGLSIYGDINKIVGNKVPLS
jgi:hypothetical protein